MKNGLNPVKRGKAPVRLANDMTAKACAGRGAEAVDQGEVEGPGQRRRCRDVELAELAAGGRAADLLVERAGGGLREVAGDGQACCRRRSGCRCW